MSITTWADLKQAVISDLNGRDDLSDTAADYLESVIRAEQRNFYYSSPITGYVDTVIGQEMYPSQAIQLGDTAFTEFTKIKWMRLLVNQVWQWLSGPVEYEYFLGVDNNVPATRSQPVAWALYDSQFRIFSAPDQVYTLELTGNGKIPIPDTDDTVNFWTQQGSDLVRFTALAQLYAIKINDPQRASQCMEVANGHRLSLIRETFGKVSTGRIRAVW